MNNTWFAALFLLTFGLLHVFLLTLGLLHG